MISIDASRLRPAENSASDTGLKPPAINSGVRIQGNTFYRTNRTAIFADSVDDLVIDENILGHTPASQKQHSQLPGTSGTQPSAIVLRNVANAEVSNNVSDVPLTIAMTDCADTVKTENNRMLTAAKLG